MNTHAHMHVHTCTHAHMQITWNVLGKLILKEPSIDFLHHLNKDLLSC